MPSSIQKLIEQEIKSLKQYFDYKYRVLLGADEIQKEINKLD